MSMEKNLNKFLEELIQEVEKELDEATATGRAGPCSTVVGYVRCTPGGWCEHLFSTRWDKVAVTR